MKNVGKNSFSKRNVLIAAASLALVLAAVGFLRAKAGAVSTLPLTRGEMTSAIYGSAQLKTERTFDLKLGTVARIADIRKSVGETVKKGEVVLLFDNLAPFKAPIDGMITAINFRNGETAFAQAVVLSIVDAKDFYLEMSLDQKSIRYVRPGQLTRVSFDGYRDLKFEGKVRATFSNGGLFYTVIDIDGMDSSFLPGMSADVAIITQTKKDVLLAPLGAIKDGKLLIKQSGRPEEIAVAVGGDDGHFAEVSSEKIKEGDLAIIRSTLPKVGASK